MPRVSTLSRAVQVFLKEGLDDVPLLGDFLLFGYGIL